MFKFLILITIVLMGCKRAEMLTPSNLTASLTVLNAIPFPFEDKTTFVVSTSGEHRTFYDANFQDYFSGNGYTSNGLRTFGLQVNKPVPFSLYAKSDTIKPLFSKMLNVSAGDVYSLFISGRSASEIDTLLLKDIIPVYTDSLIGVRFVNLSPDINDLEVYVNDENISKAPIEYKSATAFYQFAFIDRPSPFNVTFKRASDGTVLATTQIQVSAFKNTTMVLRGLVNNWPELELVRINHY